MSWQREDLIAKPKVSVITPTHNRAKFIKKSIDSVLSQTLKEFELIIVNDGSTDNTKEVVSQFIDKRIIYLEKKNGGVASARNLGLRYAIGEYISYLDDDDIYYPNHLKELVNYLDSHPEAMFVYSDSLTVSFKDNTIKKLQAAFNKKILEITDFILLDSVMHRRNCFAKVGYFDEDLLVASDWDMWLRISDLYNLHHLPKVTSVHFVHGRNLSAIAKRYYYVWLMTKKRISQAKSQNKLLAYINNFAIGIVERMLFRGAVNYAHRLANGFYHVIKNYQTIACLGLCSLGRAQFKEARNLFKKSLKMAPPRWQTFDNWQKRNILKIKVNLAKAEYHLGNFDLAIKNCRQILKRIPQDKETKIILLWSFIKKGLYSKALVLARQLGPPSPWVHKLRGYCYLKNGEYFKAMQEFKKASVIERKKRGKYY